MPAPELIIELPYRVVDSTAQEYYASVAGEQRIDGQWEGWLEYVPLDENDAYLTPTETTQASRAALEQWATGLEETYVKGAFARAVAATTAATSGRLVARRIPTATPLLRTEVPDPFESFRLGAMQLRTRLAALPRATLLQIIATHGLNPAGKSLAWLTNAQLVTFIVTAVDAQIRMAKRPI